jgi:hypothetical protein
MYRRACKAGTNVLILIDLFVFAELTLFMNVIVDVDVCVEADRGLDVIDGCVG